MELDYYHQKFNVFHELPNYLKIKSLGNEEILE